MVCNGSVYTRKCFLCLFQIFLAQSFLAKTCKGIECFYIALTRKGCSQGNGPYLPPRSGAIRKPSITPPSLHTVPRRPRTRPDYSKIITASCGQACCGPDATRRKAQSAEQPGIHRREMSLRA